MAGCVTWGGQISRLADVPNYHPCMPAFLRPFLSLSGEHFAQINECQIFKWQIFANIGFLLFLIYGSEQSKEDRPGTMEEAW
jgi:hypothetical protein